MESRRQMKLASVIREAFTDILTREGKSIYGNSFVTVTNVKVTPDLGLARFYLSIYQSDDPEQVLEHFKNQKQELKRKLAEKIRHQLRIMPEIEFFRDETLDYAYHIEEVFQKIKEEDQQIAAGARKKVVKKIAKPAAKKASAKTKSAAKKSGR